MKTIFKLICFLILFTSMARAEFEEIQSLNQGSCWYKESDTGVKVSSFSNNVSAELNNEFMSSLNGLNLPVSFNETYSSQLFCSTHGLSLVMNVNEGGKKYCLWLNILDKGLEVQSVGLTEFSNNCDGYRPGKLLVTLSKGSDLEAVARVIKDSDEVFSVEKVSSNVLDVKIVKHLYGQEDSVSKSIEELKEVKFAEKSFFYHPIGEWGELNFLKRE
jgi:hypothetical protein